MRNGVKEDLPADEEAFLRAVACAPDDDLPRLVYADWLDERGGAGDAERAELIRLSIQLTRKPPPPTEVGPLVRRECELLAAVQPWWAALLPTGWDEPTLARGFVERVRLNMPQRSRTRYQLRADERRLFDLLPLRSVHSYRASRAFLRQFLRNPSVRRLRELDLSGNQLIDEDAELIAGSPHLGRVQVLNLFDNRVGRDGLVALATSPRLAALRTVHVGRNPVGGAALAELVRQGLFREHAGGGLLVREGQSDPADNCPPGQ